MLWWWLLLWWRLRLLRRLLLWRWLLLLLLWRGLLLLPSISVFRTSGARPWAPKPWHPTRPNKGPVRRKGPFHPMRWWHCKAPWSWWRPSVHHVWWHGTRWHHRKALQMRWRHSWRALKWDQAGSGPQKTSRWCLQPNYRAGCNSLSA